MKPKNLDLSSIKGATSPMFLRIVRNALEEAYQNDVVDTLMESRIIGEGKYYVDKDEWMQCKLEEWMEVKK